MSQVENPLINSQREREAHTLELTNVLTVTQKEVHRLLKVDHEYYLQHQVRYPKLEYPVYIAAITEALHHWDEGRRDVAFGYLLLREREAQTETERIAYNRSAGALLTQPLYDMPPKPYRSLMEIASMGDPFAISYGYHIAINTAQSKAGKAHFRKDDPIKESFVGGWMVLKCVEIETKNTLSDTDPVNLIRALAHDLTVTKNGLSPTQVEHQILVANHFKEVLGLYQRGEKTPVLKELLRTLGDLKMQEARYTRRIISDACERLLNEPLINSPQFLAGMGSLISETKMNIDLINDQIEALKQQVLHAGTGDYSGALRLGEAVTRQKIEQAFYTALLRNIQTHTDKTDDASEAEAINAYEKARRLLFYTIPEVDFIDACEALQQNEMNLELLFALVRADHESLKLRVLDPLNGKIVMPLFYITSNLVESLPDKVSFPRLVAYLSNRAVYTGNDYPEIPLSTFADAIDYLVETQNFYPGKTYQESGTEVRLHDEQLKKNTQQLSQDSEVYAQFQIAAMRLNRELNAKKPDQRKINLYRSAYEQARERFFSIVEDRSK